MADERRLDIKVGMDQGQLAHDIKITKEHIKNFRAEINKTDAEMKAFGKSSDALGKKKETLTKQLAAEEKQMDMLTEAYALQVEKSGENTKGALKLEREINNLGAQMASTQSKIEAVTQEIDDLSTSSDGAGDSTVDLYNNIGESNEKLKTAESNLKAAESATKLYGTSTETLKDKLGALGSVQDAQKEKMSALEAAYNREVQKSGESSAASQKLRQEMNNLQAQMNNTQSAIDSTTNELSELTAEAPNTEENIENLTESLGSMVMQHVIDYLQKVGDKLLEIGKNAITTSADIQAHNELWDQVFSKTDEASGAVVSYSDEARTALKSVADETGIMVTAMEEGFIKANQQFLSIGTDNNTSLKQAADLMLYSADAAAAYNVELDTSQRALQSFVKGNNSAGESVGIFARETQMMTYAVEKGYIDISEQQEQFLIDSQLKVDKAQQKYNKVLADSESTSVDIADAQNKLNKAIKEQEDGLKVTQTAWTQLDEATKQAVRVDYIKNAYEMSRVLGQAHREQDAWENVTRNFTEAQRQMNAVLGEAAIELLIPIVQSLTAIIIDLTQWFSNLSPEVKKVVTIIAGAIIVFAKFAPMIMGIVNSFSMLKIAMGTTGKSMNLLGKIGSLLTNKWVLIGVAIAAIIAIFLNFDKIMAWGKERWPETFNKLEEVVNNLGEVFSNVWTVIKDVVMGVAKELEPLISSMIDVISKMLSSLLDVFMVVFGSILTFITENQESILKIITFIWTVITSVIDGFLTALLPIFQMAFQVIGSIVEAAFIVIKDIVETTMNLISGIITFILQVITGDWHGAWETIQNTLSTFGEDLINLAGSIFTLLYTTVNNILTFFVLTVLSIFNGLKVALSGIWDLIGESATALWNVISKTVTDIVKNVKDYVEKTFNDLKTNVGKIWDDIKVKAADVWEQIKNSIGSVTGTVDNVIQSFKNLWDNVKNIFDNIKNKIIDTWSNVKDKISQLNPFSAQHKVSVVSDDNPYDPFAAMGPNIDNQPKPNIGALSYSAVGAISSSLDSISRGLNSTFNDLNDLYAFDAELNNNKQRNKISNGGKDPYMDILIDILEVLIASNNKDDVFVIDKDVIARKIHQPLTKLQNMEDNRKNKMRGDVNYR